MKRSVNKYLLNVFTMVALLSLLLPSASLAMSHPIYPGAVKGYVYNDYNLNGKHEASEPGIAGVTVALTPLCPSDPCISLPRKTLTDKNGIYAFYSLPAGYYLVTEYNLPGYMSTTPDNVSVYVRYGTYVDFGDVMIWTNN